MSLALIAMSAMLLAAAAASAQGELTLCLKKAGDGKATITTPYDLGFGDVLTAGDAEFFLSNSGGSFSIIGTPSEGDYHISLGACKKNGVWTEYDVDHAFACAGQPSGGLPGVWTVLEKSVFPDWMTFATGYWTPYAMPGNVEGGNNIGSYHLLCYLPPGMKETGGFIGGDGKAVPAEYPYVVEGNPIPGVYREIG